MWSELTGMRPVLKYSLSAGLLTLFGLLIYWSQRKRHTNSAPEYPKVQPHNEGGNAADWFERKRLGFSTQVISKRRLLELLHGAVFQNLEQLLRENGISEEQFLQSADKFRNDEEVSAALLALDGPVSQEL
jgi:hypothetical protein